MKWKRIPKENSEQPASGIYSDWKDILAEEGAHQCVYCAIPEPRFGGIRNFHVEHYRPKSNKRFKKLINDIHNLYFACAICNTFKSDDWPAEPDPTYRIQCYPDPSVTDYSDIISILDNGRVDGRYPASKYVTEMLFLNRPQLIYERRYSALLDRQQTAMKNLAPIIDELVNHATRRAVACLGQLTKATSHLTEVLRKMHSEPTYTTKDIKRPKQTS